MISENTKLFWCLKPDWHSSNIQPIHISLHLVKLISYNRNHGDSDINRNSFQSAIISTSYPSSARSDIIQERHRNEPCPSSLASHDVPSLPISYVFNLQIIQLIINANSTDLSSALPPNSPPIISASMHNGGRGMRLGSIRVSMMRGR